MDSLRSDRERSVSRKWLPYLIIALGTLVPRIVFIMFISSIRLPMDEMGTVAGAAYFAGLDWSAVISRGSYYGNGFSALLSPIFLLTDNPYVIHGLISLVYALMYLGISYIAYHILVKYFGVRNLFFSCAAAIACSYPMAYRTTTFSNEHPLTLITWLLAWLFMEMVTNEEDYRKRRFHTLALAVLLCYSLTVHTRAVTYWLALAVLIVLYWWRYRRWLISWGTLGICCIPGYFAAQKFIGYVQSFIWEAGNKEELVNASISVSVGGLDLTSPAVWKGWLFTICGQLNTMLIMTSGVLFLAVIIIFCLCFRGVFMRKRDIAVCKKMADEQERRNYRLYYAAGGYFLCCMLITIGGQSITWLSGAAAGVADGYGTMEYGVKAFTYVRYFANYTGPVLLLGLSYLYFYGEKLKKYILAPFLAGYGALQFIWIRGILRYIYQNPYGVELFYAFSLRKKGEDTGTYMGTYMWAVCITAVLVAVIVVCLYKKRWKPVLMILCCSLIYQYAYGSLALDRAMSVVYSERTDGGFRLVKELEKEGTAVDRIYVVDMRSSAHKSYYVYQFLLNRYEILPIEPEDTCEEGIILTNREIPEFKGRGYYFGQLDENEYIYVNGMKDIQIIRQQGISLEEYKD